MFDSGIGGINLLYECVKKLPHVDFFYFADNFRVPYGSLDDAVLKSYVTEFFDEIEEIDPAAAVIACNTVTARCAEYLRSRYRFNIIGIQPAVKPASEIGGKCLVLCTPSTAASSSLKLLMDTYCREGETAACPDLAEYIEKHIFSLREEDIFPMLPDVRADCVVLGCTHYSFIKDIVKSRYNCPVFDGNEGTGNRLKNFLGIGDHRAPHTQKVCFCSGDRAKNSDVFSFLMREKGINSHF